ncbi:MAG: basic amino acid ABC transporter substrate-binding protein [Desulfovibrionales bacterium]|nr:basic amino acid ABC transporter substrate-binding protein [Desulfovibrionales bacterium]
MFKRFVVVLLTFFCLTGSALAKDLVFAVDATYPPMEMVDAQKNIVGFGPELVAAIGKAAGFNAVTKNTAWDGIFAGLAAGKYDAICSSVSITDERKATMDFTDPYFDVKQGVIVAKGVTVNSLADLAGKTVASQIGTTGYFVCKKIEGAKAKSYDEIGLAVEDLYNGRCDAVIADDAVASNYALQHEQYSKKLTLAYLITPEKPEYLGIAVKKGDDKTRELINAGLKKIKENGEYDAIYKKWFSTK